MDLNDYSLEDLLLTAIKSEVEANELYSRLGERVDSSFLKDRLEFIAKEEIKHREFLESIYKNHYPRKDIQLPEKSAVPMPGMDIPENVALVSEVISKAMEGEKVASDFYLALSEIYDGDDETKKTLRYLSDMESGHYNLLEMEYNRLRDEEDYEIEWEMMHAGP